MQVNLGLLFAVALAANEHAFAQCSVTLPPDVSSCIHTTAANWNEAKRLVFELNREVASNPPWRLPTAAQLGTAELPCDANRTTTELWWMTSAFLKHGDEILVGAYHCDTGITEFVPVNQPLKLLLLR
ncbi:hypothetical protein [Pseudidiomarina homiensis]|uniref:DUF1566 domain-containing protein n=1 Tax=Pseudidiomarina homiensis TaxID=364198 RepID=A0A432XY42_9GAMM|nr:hypothetical protein [Pseudidiomarina homiensis]RUO53668.1 hypothetical protein CWI70_10860 [Pseudidiomarina homiensis]